ncbi:MAG: hypothetical protein ACR2N3_02990 [Pyrinomonadaceae bacterium]
MNFIKKNFICVILLFSAVLASSSAARAQTKIEVLNGEALTKIVPTSFYFAGQSAQTQMRNAAAAQLGENRNVIAGLVDTSGYSTEISGKYEGFLITDSPINVGDEILKTGAYGFGFSKDGKMNIFDLSGKQILSVGATNDTEMKRPRPLMMTGAANGIRFYKGKTYVMISAK